MLIDALDDIFDLSNPNERSSVSHSQGHSWTCHVLWHVFVEYPRSLNDINVMSVSALSSTYMESAALKTKYTIGNTQFEGAFFLADGIYL